MYRITQDPSSGSDSLYLVEITYSGSHVPVMCVIGVWQHIMGLWCACVHDAARTHTHHRPIICCQTPIAHTTGTCEPLYVISTKYRLSLCCVLSGRGLCDGLIIRPEESYRLWSVVVCEQETSKTRRLKPANGL
jgi:hypothetical protein